jgi:hypothetical protein
VAVALAAPDPVTGEPLPDGWTCLPAATGTGLLIRPAGPDQALALGALVQRVAVAAWAEDLAVGLRIEPGPALLVEPAG